MIRTTCPYCGVGCGVLAAPDGAGGLVVKGDPDHPANRGRLCSKGAALGETVGLDGRLLAPVVDGAETDWDTALDRVAQRFSDAIRDHGPDSVAFYVSGQMLTEDYYVANKLMKGFIGSANIDTNSRLCMASSVAGHKRAFGTDTVPGVYGDLELADLVVLVGSNLAWCHPVLYQRIAAAKAARPEMKIVTVDPRVTATSDLADLHLALTPGSDVALFNHLLAAIQKRGAVDSEFVLEHVADFPEAVRTALCSDPEPTGLSHAEIEQFVRLWIGTEKVVTVYSQGVNQSAQGTDKVNAILNCHLATGRIGRPGMGPFSVTGQPNAMGGREVGGLANQLAAHLDIENPAHRQAVRAFWCAPAIPETPGLKAVEMFEAVRDGRIKALWIICTNPAVSLPEADAVRAAIASCAFTVVSDCTAKTDTARLADVLLPATTWGEKDGTVTNSERCISRQRPALPAPGQARHDWEILSEVGRRMGWSRAFDYSHPAEIFAEHAELSGVAAGLGKDFDISGLAGLGRSDYDAMTPVRWPVADCRTGGRFFGDGRFFTKDGRARMIAVSAQDRVSADWPARPFVLNTGRIRDQWHTMTRSGQSARLAGHLAEPFAEMNPADAARLGAKPSDLLEVTNDHGRAILRVLVTDRVAPGQVFAPIHWSAENASAARIAALVPAIIDPVSGQPDSKAARVSIRRYDAAWYGFAASVVRPTPDCAYWARARTAAGWRVELAGTQPKADWTAFARDLLGCATAESVTMDDDARGTRRIAFHQEGRLVAVLFAGSEPVAVSRRHVADQLGTEAPGILAGRPGGEMPDPGQTLCSCMGVGINTISRAIRDGGLTTVDGVGAATGAGTSCGSCRSEIAELILRLKVPEAAE
ncbi:molybdopterin-dependent oxidoreductase [Sulfitobacter sp. D35]|uniref:molybdopterin-dependent oxidoreductase n=1 Tax=Sulfitobacter sp. D35 TaxID=3083252 RepID=UPI00296EAE7E|nr:molybdopterin-dependent oxidoreductase [Sulfitobacter sp. D35]MDW4498913.1 molybdopterin-dependent oxidoreductase [Sulfitobacter sp. D35]